MINRNIAPSVEPLSIPTILPHQQFTLENGIEVIYVHDPNQQVFKIDIVFEAGVYYQSQALVSSTTMNMLNEGTQKYNAEAIADLFDFYGAYLDFNCGLNKSELSLFSLNKYATETITMLVEMLTDSVIPEKELDIFLTNKRQEFLVNQEKTAYIARKKFSELFFGCDHPYSNQVSEQDYSQISVPVLRDFYEQHINARNCRIVVCGNVSSSILETIKKEFSKLNTPEQRDTFKEQAFMPAPAGRYHIEKSNSVQSSIRMGKSGVRLTEADYAGFMLLNTILGGYFGSRLMSNIREEKGFTYSINSFNVTLPQGSYWCIATDVNNEYVEATIQETLKEIKTLQTEAVSAEELDLVKKYLHGELLRELDGVFAQSDSLKHKLNHHLDNHIYPQLIEQINTCTADDLRTLANKYMNTEEMYIITVGK